MAAAFALVSFSSSLSAQTTCTRLDGGITTCNSLNGSNTMCNDVGPDMTNCTTYGAPSASPSNDGSGAIVGYLWDRLRAGHEEKMEAKIAAALNAGDCGKAHEIAANTANVNLMVAVQHYCAAMAAAR